MSILDDVPEPIIGVSLVFIEVIVKLVRAGEDREARREALMGGVEGMKRQLDTEKFGGP